MLLHSQVPGLGIRLRDGMEKTYQWIGEEYQKQHAAQAVSGNA